jgi:hypothetical protein
MDSCAIVWALRNALGMGSGVQSVSVVDYLAETILGRSVEHFKVADGYFSTPWRVVEAIGR